MVTTCRLVYTLFYLKFSIFCEFAICARAGSTCAHGSNGVTGQPGSHCCARTRTYARAVRTHRHGAADVLVNAMMPPFRSRVELLPGIMPGPPVHAAASPSAAWRERHRFSSRGQPPFDLLLQFRSLLPVSSPASHILRPS